MNEEKASETNSDKIFERIVPYVKWLRDYESVELLRMMKKYRCLEICEVGAGAGWQSKYLMDNGLKVSCCDLDTSRYKQFTVLPVTKITDGRIPFSTGIFDAVFTSQVLQAVTDVAIFHAEIRRVLKPNGIVIHTLPTSTWRVLNLLGYYLLPLTHLSSVIRTIRSSDLRASPNTSVEGNTQGMDFFTRLIKRLKVRSQSRYESIVSEFWHFRKMAWRQLFAENNLELMEVASLKLFYSGWSIFGRVLPLWARNLLARLFGSASVLFVLQFRGDAPGSNDSPS